MSWLRAAAPLLLAACAGTGKVVSSDASTTSGQTETDADADADSDTDTDADSDTDADADTGTPTIESDDCTTAFTACGGDPTGSWDIASLCTYGVNAATTATYYSAFCTGDQLDVQIAVFGTIDFDADTTYTIDIETSGTFTYGFPAACVSYAGIGSCDQLTPYVDGATSCAADGAGGCICDGDVYDAYSSDISSGNWVATGDQLVLTDEYGSSDLDYCVDGDVLRLDDAAEDVDVALTR